MVIKTSDIGLIKPFLKRLYILPAESHKGQNGKVLIIGGSHLFHAASIWSALTASHFVDMVHYASTQENNEIIMSLKKKFINGIVVRQKDLECYIKEDDAVLIGPGMVRTDKKIFNFQFSIFNFEELKKIKNEGEFTYYLTKYLLNKYLEKRWVLDAGALQMMDINWLKQLKTKAVITPHQLEFEKLFGINIIDKQPEEKIKIVEKKAKEFNCVILLKAIIDIISDGDQTIVIEGGNPGLTKGGTGDVLAGMATSFYAKNDPLVSAVMASYLLKKTADILSKTKGSWYNIGDIINKIPETLKEFI